MQPYTQPDSARKRRIEAQLRIFQDRAVDVFRRVFEGSLLLIDAADLMNDAATSSGLADEIGIDNVQRLLAAAVAVAAAENDRQQEQP